MRHFIYQDKEVGGINYEFVHDNFSRSYRNVLGTYHQKITTRKTVRVVGRNIYVV